MWLLQTLRWWLVVEAIGLLALPLAMVLLRFLPERGVTFRRPLGLLLGGALYWLLVTLGVLYNTPTGAVAALLLVGMLSLAAGRRQWVQIRGELARLRSYLVLEGVVFFLALVVWSFFRAHNPEIAATEKPMEFAFLNGILRSPNFPPRDPWLAGYGISYYYLGYVIMALLTLVSGLPSAVTFNLTGTLLFALTVSGSLALTYNLVCAAQEGTGARAGLSRAGMGAGLLGATLTAVMGNLVGVFELIRARGWGSEALWRWLDVRNLGAAPPSPTWYPQDVWWWWRASRVIHDRDLAGNSQEVISEFPFFSFLLGDNHPHVLGLPFVLLAMALALNVLLGAIRGKACTKEPASGLGTPAVLLRSRAGQWVAALWQGGAWELLLWGVLLGALGFLNTWDYPIYLALLLGAYVVGQHIGGRRNGWYTRALSLGALLLAVGLLAYLFFYLGFRSQAGGIGLAPPWIKTQWQQFLLMFGVQVVLLAGFLVQQAGALWRLRRACPPPVTAFLAAGGLWFAALAAGLLGWYTATLGLFLLGLSGGVLLWGAAARAAGHEAPSLATLMALLMAVGGLALVVSVEFVYLRDVFGTRMNTVFKFYYQGWVLLSLVAAYGVYQVLHSLWRGAPAVRTAALAWASLGAILLLCGLVYPAMATMSKANGFAGQPTLDGVRYVAEQRGPEYGAILWLQRHARAGAVLLEAPGGSYSAYNWISAHTGIPTLLGWGGHQLQWRGSYQIPGEREPAIEAVYEGRDPVETRRLLQQYGVDYVIVGPMERQRYAVDEAVLAKLDSLMARVYENNGVIIWARSW